MELSKTEFLKITPKLTPKTLDNIGFYWSFLESQGL